MFQLSIESGKCKSITVAALTAFASALLATTAASACGSDAARFANYSSYGPGGYSSSTTRHAVHAPHPPHRHTVRASEKARVSTPAAATDDRPSEKNDASTTAEAVPAAAAPAPASAIPTRTSTPVPASAVAANASMAPSVGPVCDGFLSNGCYLAKQKVSTTKGIELRCTVMCQ